MANRRLQRSIAMQSLFEWDFNGEKEEGILDIVDRNIKDLAVGEIIKIPSLGTKQT